MTREIAEQAEIEADKKGIKIQVRGADSLPSPFWVCADKHFVGQVLVNLIINSIRYGKEGGVTRIKFRDMLDKILVEVEDNGVGIAKEDVPRIFERFTVTDKGRSTRSRAVRGSDWRSSSILSKLTASESTSAASWE